ncbi:LysR family transcriptional regulator [Citricoccus alkalitolerans]|uniref:LysR family transcriptional regulator n=1 Tax=Citricoccus alkalitolerans TaxID=246603 RepID=A0ABV8XX42_9MICC
MGHFELSLIPTFIAIYETGSLTRAAETLAISQPSVSYTLAKLRKQLSDPLFVRTAEGMQPTRRAIELFAVFKAVANDVEDVVQKGREFDARTSNHTFRLCLSDLGELAFLPAVTERLAVEAPQVLLEVVPMQIDHVAEWLELGTVDAAIASVELPGHARQEILDQERYVCVIPQGLDADNPAAPEGGRLSVEQFGALRHVVIDRAMGHSQADAALATLGVGRDVRLRLPHFASVPAALTSSDLAVIVPLRVAQIFQRLWPVTVRELPVEIPSFDVRLYWKDAETRSTPAEWFLDFLRRVLAEAGTGNP